MFAMQFLRRLYEANIAYAMRPLRPEAFFASGDRLAFEKAYFARRKCLTAAALLYLTGGDVVDLSHAEAEAWRILGEPTWVHPAHGDPIDLFAAETGFLLAETAAYLPYSAACKARIAAELKSRIVAPFLSSSFSWEKTGGNWLAVCMGNIGGTLYYADPAAFSAQRARIEGGLLRYLGEFPPDGWCMEGLEYWNFGFGAFVRFAELLFPDMLRLPAVRAIAGYPHRCFLRGNVTASFGDCPMRGRADRGLVNFLAKQCGTPLLTAKESAIRSENCAYLPLSRTLRDGCAVAENHEYEGGLYQNSVAIHHTAAYSLALKAGDNGEPHNHNDVGSFILSAECGQLVCDLGQPRYDRDYFSERRYENLAASSFGHSVPIVCGKGQGTGKAFAGVLEDGLTVDLSGAYEGGERLLRRFTLEEDGVLLVDEFSAEEITERFVLWNDPAAGALKILPEKGEVTFRKTHFFTHGGRKMPIWLADLKASGGRCAVRFLLPREEKRGTSANA